MPTSSGGTQPGGKRAFPSWNMAEIIWESMPGMAGTTPKEPYPHSWLGDEKRM